MENDNPRAWKSMVKPMIRVEWGQGNDVKPQVGQEIRAAPHFLAFADLTSCGMPKGGSERGDHSERDGYRE